MVTAKQPTTPDDQSEGVIAAVHAALERAGARPGDLERLRPRHDRGDQRAARGRAARGRRSWPPRASPTSIELGRQARAELYRLCATHPAPLVARELRFGAPERTTPDGAAEELEPTTRATSSARALEEAAPEAVAVVLLHSYRHPEHEQRIGEALRERSRDAHVSLSHEVAGTFREYERAATTEVDAASPPCSPRYLRRLRERARGRGPAEPSIMQSNGGAASLERPPAHAVVDGPVRTGGRRGRRRLRRARRPASDDALCFDMGGTSCDVCVVDGGAVRERQAARSAAARSRCRCSTVHTVGAGGGSIAWRDPAARCASGRARRAPIPGRPATAAAAPSRR